MGTQFLRKIRREAKFYTNYSDLSSPFVGDQRQFRVSYCAYIKSSRELTRTWEIVRFNRNIPFGRVYCLFLRLSQEAIIAYYRDRWRILRKLPLKVKDDNIELITIRYVIGE